MALLKRIKASTLMETMVATVLIVIIFAVASSLLNSIFLAQIKGNTAAVDTHLGELEYAYRNGKIPLPYEGELQGWEVRMSAQEIKGLTYVVLEAQHRETGKTTSSHVVQN
ncbi:hypothetical protein WIW50_01940 [Flavobacteriaceae bacterium 3-367]|uniref:hypothetical protein n=1 Tax=Eudoraea algarum TaxID=3417568 RepID=UPI00328E91B3